MKIEMCYLLQTDTGGSEAVNQISRGCLKAESNYDK